MALQAAGGYSDDVAIERTQALTLHFHPYLSRGRAVVFCYP